MSIAKQKAAFVALVVFLFLAHAAAFAQALPEGFVTCAGEGEQCAFEGTREVRYGVDTRWKVMTATNGIKCDYVTFGGDPAYGVRKRCYIGAAATSNRPVAFTGALPAGYQACGTEGRRCQFSGTREVRYGVDTRWRVVTATNGISCDYATFGGDPAPNVVKQCFVRQSAATPATPDASGYQRFVVGAPSSTDVIPPSAMASLLGANTASAGTATRMLDETALPFPLDDAFPAFYLIPSNKRPKILNQAGCGSCVAWSTTTALASVLANSGKYPTFDANAQMPDALKFFSMAGRNCPAGGWNIGDAVNRMTTYGTFLSNVEPVSKTQAFDSFIQELFNSPTASKPINNWWVRAGRSGSLTKTNAMRRFIYERGALVADFAVTKAFGRYQAGVFNQTEMVDKIVAASASQTTDVVNSMRTDLNTITGYHAVTIIGYFKGGQISLAEYMSPLFPGVKFPDIQMNMPAFWIVQNSWTDKWGMNGLFYMAADQPAADGWEYSETAKTMVASKIDVIDDRMYFMLDPVIVSASSGRDVNVATPSPRSVTLRNESGYGAQIHVYYVDPEAGPTAPQKLISSNAIPVGQGATIELPPTKPGTKVTVKLTGLLTNRNDIYTTTIDGSFEGVPCYKVWGTIFDPQGGECSDTTGMTTTADRALTFRNEAGFVAKMMIQYMEIGAGGIPLPKILVTDNIGVGQIRTIVVPAAAPNTPIGVYLIGTGTSKDSIFSQSLESGFTGSRCYKAWGTIFSPQGGTCQ